MEFRQKTALTWIKSGPEANHQRLLSRAARFQSQRFPQASDDLLARTLVILPGFALDQ
jgi:hypothetical protein